MCASNLIHIDFDASVEQCLSPNERLVDCAQEIESPYNRKHDALKDSDDEDMNSRRR